MDINHLFGVKGKVILVTGGAKGIGRMISTGFVTNGAKVYISSRDGPTCESVAAELNAEAAAAGSGGSAVALPADLSQLDECRRLVAELSRREDRLHVLVNNSGAAWGAAYDEFPDSAWTKVLVLNLQRVFTLTQLLTPMLEAAAASSQAPAPSGDDDPSSPQRARPFADPARVINIGSIDALRVPSTANFSYSAAKAGLHDLSRRLAVELGPRGITSNVVACGPFPSKMMRATLDAFGGVMADTMIPLQRVGEPADAAGACIFLAGRAGAYVNGATIRVDGGMSLQPVAKL